MIYIASPFFCRFDNVVKKQMMLISERIDEVVDPEKCGTFCLETKTINTNQEKFKLAKKIFDSNLTSLCSCNKLIFPKYTTDLGTLFELGVAIYQKKKIFRFDFLNQEVTEFNEDLTDRINNFAMFSRKLDCIVVSIKQSMDAVLFGALSGDFRLYDKLVYELPGTTKDNLMLASSFPKMMNGKIIDPEEREDWEKIR